MTETWNGVGRIKWRQRFAFRVSADSLNFFSKIDKMDSKIGFEMTMCEYHDSKGNGFGDIWWTDKLIYFSIIDVGFSKCLGSG